MTDVTVHQNKHPLVVIVEKLEDRKEELRKALVDIDPDHFIRAVKTAATLNPNLQACSFNSLWIACLEACRDNLLPNGIEGVIVPYKDKAQWIPMYRGLLKRFRDSGECKWITANVVRQDEVFEHWITEGGEHFKHIPDGDEKAKIIKVYAAARTKDDAFYCAVMSMSEIEQIKRESRAKSPDSPWQKFPGEMMKKTALRRLCKLLPAGANIFQHEEEEERQAKPVPQLAVDNEAPRAPGAAAALDTFAGAPHSTPLPHVSYNEPGAMDDAISIAYERGRIAKETGAARKAIPTEYREEANRAEADAWYAGWDGREDPGSGEIPD